MISRYYFNYNIFYLLKYIFIILCGFTSSISAVSAASPKTVTTKEIAGMMSKIVKDNGFGADIFQTCLTNYITQAEIGGFLAFRMYITPQPNCCSILTQLNKQLTEDSGLMQLQRELSDTYISLSFCTGNLGISDDMLYAYFSGSIGTGSVEEIPFSIEPHEPNWDTIAWHHDGYFAGHIVFPVAQELIPVTIKLISIAGLGGGEFIPRISSSSSLDKNKHYPDGTNNCFRTISLFGIGGLSVEHQASLTLCKLEARVSALTGYCSGLRWAVPLQVIVGIPVGRISIDVGFQSGGFFGGVTVMAFMFGMRCSTGYPTIYTKTPDNIESAHYKELMLFIC